MLWESFGLDGGFGEVVAVAVDGVDELEGGYGMVLFL